MTDTISPLTDIRALDLVIFEGRLDSIAKEMGYVMARASRSPIFSQAHDFSCFIADGHGQVLSQADGIPVHTGGGGFVMKHMLNHYGDGLSNGDVVIASDPYATSNNHTADWTLIAPVIENGMLRFICAVRAHQADIGGGAVGGYNAEATDIFMEGLRLPFLKLVEAGNRNTELIDLLCLNTRQPTTTRGDLEAMMSSLSTGVRRLNEIIADTAGPRVEALCVEYLDYSERRMRAELSKIPDGVYEGVESTWDPVAKTDVPIHVRITVDGSDIEVDLSRTGSAALGFKNSAIANTHSAVYMALATLVDPDVPHNEGAYRSVKIVTRPGSLVHALPPSAHMISTAFPAAEIIHAVWRAAATTMPEQISAGWGKFIIPVLASPADADSPFVTFLFQSMAGIGATSDRDGIDCAGPLNTLMGVHIPSIETYESKYPVRFEEWEFRSDAAGAGKHRGGSGIRLVFHTADICILGMRGEGIGESTGFGVAGGAAGAGGTARVLASPDHAAKDLPRYGSVSINGARVEIETASGGGWGPPDEREVEAVLADVRDGFYSVDFAYRAFGVAIQADNCSVDDAATAARRGLLKRKRGGLA